MPGAGAGKSLDWEARELVERHGGRWTANGGLCRCPAHDDRSPSLSVRVGRSSLLLHCFAGCAPADILRALRAAGRPVVSLTPTPAKAEAGGAGNAAAALRLPLRLWGASGPLGGTPASAYLERRGIDLPSAELRYHPRTPHGPKPLTQFRPALIAAVRDGSGLVAVHRTFLDARSSRLADIPERRCGLGRFGRGAVRLGGVAGRLGLAEGIETALSASTLFGLPCWATLGTERFGLVELPREVRELVLFLDNDAGGRRAEQLAREAHAHLPIESLYAEPRGADWNEVLLARQRASWR